MEQLYEPDKFLMFVRDNLKKQWGVAFFSSIVFGFLAHMFMIVGLYSNHDGILRYYNDADWIRDGRWFFHFTSSISTRFTMPWIIGIFSIFLLSLVVICLVDLFNVRKNLSVILLAAITICFPAIGSTFSYMFLADSYMLALLLSVLAVVLTIKLRFGFALGGAALALSMGIYQSYLSYCATLVVLLLIFDLLEQKLDMKAFLFKGVRFACMGVIGVSLYYGILQYFMRIRNTTLSSYQGINMSDLELSIGTLSAWISNSYQSFISFIGTLSKISHINFFIIFYFILFVSYLIITLVNRKIYNSVWRAAIMAICIFSIPLLLNLFGINPGTSYHMIMRQDWSLLFILLIILSDRYPLSPSMTARVILQWASVCVGFAITIQFILITNISYMNIRLRQDKEFSFLIRVVDRIEQFESDGENMPLYVAGLRSHVSDHVNYTSGVTDHMVGMEGNYYVNNQARLQAFLEYHLNCVIVSPTPGQINDLQQSEQVINMPVWPHKDCIQEIDGVIVVKVGDNLK